MKVNTFWNIIRNFEKDFFSPVFSLSVFLRKCKGYSVCKWLYSLFGTACEVNRISGIED